MVLNDSKIKQIFLTGEACSTYTAVRAGGVWCVITKSVTGLYKEVIEVDDLNKGSISAQAGKQEE